MSKACVTILKSRDMRICVEKTAKQNTKWNHLTAKQRPKLRAGRKGGDDFRFTKTCTCGPLPLQISKDKRPYCLGSACRASLGVVPAQGVRYGELGNRTLPAQKTVKRGPLRERLWARVSERRTQKGAEAGEGMRQHISLDSFALNYSAPGPRGDYQIPEITKKCSRICSLPEVFE